MTGQERYLNTKNDVRLPTKQYFHFCTENLGYGLGKTVYPLFSGLVTGSGKNVFFFEKKAKILGRCAMKIEKTRFFEMSKKCVFWHFLVLVPIFGQF